MSENHAVIQATAEGEQPDPKKMVGFFSGMRSHDRCKPRPKPAHDEPPAPRPARSREPGLADVSSAPR